MSSIKDQIISALEAITEAKEINLEFPDNAAFGDYSTNIAMILAKKEGKNPRKLAEEIVTKLLGNEATKKLIEKIEVAGPGFINFWLKKEVLIDNLIRIDTEKEKYGSADWLSGKKILIEHTSPNPQTTIMLGHLRNNFLGMSVANLLSFSGAEVIRDCIVNDRGVHICRSIWGYLVFASKKSGLVLDELKDFRTIPDRKVEEISLGVEWKKLLADWMKNKSNWLLPSNLGLKPDHANLIWYVLGSKAYKLQEKVQREVGEILQAWEKEEKDVWEIWRQILDWSKEGYAETYKRVESFHDWVWYESDLYQGGKELVIQGLKKGIFQKSEGAIVTNLKKYGLADMVVIKSDGTATYLVFDLNLTRQKEKKFPSDLYIWTIGVEQSLYFKQMFAVCEQLGLGERDHFYHLAYELINFKGKGKMSTREGSVVMADEILDELEKKARKISQSETMDVVRKVALGAIKYALLKNSRNTTMFFDIAESISLEGNSGPYLQYTVARANSVLAKSANGGIGRFINNPKIEINEEELSVLRSLVRFPEIVASATINYSPNLLCNYLYDLAQKFNTFYNKHRILGTTREVELFRVLLTKATGQVLKNGLGLLGIQVPERM